MVLAKFIGSLMNIKQKSWLIKHYRWFIVPIVAFVLLGFVARYIGIIIHTIGRVFTSIGKLFLGLPGAAIGELNEIPKHSYTSSLKDIL